MFSYLAYSFKSFKKIPTVLATKKWFIFVDVDSVWPVQPLAVQGWRLFSQTWCRSVFCWHGNPRTSWAAPAFVTCKTVDNHTVDYFIFTCANFQFLCFRYFTETLNYGNYFGKNCYQTCVNSFHGSIVPTCALIWTFLHYHLRLICVSTTFCSLW